MSEDEIEYLDEDEDIVQQCVKQSQPKFTPTRENSHKSMSQPLLVERSAQKRKKIEEDESDYDPSDDNLPQSPPSSPPARKKKHPAKKIKTTIQKAHLRDINSLSIQNEYMNRKKFNIRIPDYDDPLCLPVRALKQDSFDIKRLNNWNKVCLEHFKHYEMLKPEHGVSKKSVRSAVFKNVVNNQTGNTETTIWSKTTVENEAGDKKSEIFQCILPRYKEKKVLGNFILGTHRFAARKVTSEVVLSKEEHKDGEVLVVYKPKDSVSAVYTLVDKRKVNEEVSNNESQLYMRELTSCRMCAPCFHSSWRGQKVQQMFPDSLICPICAKTCVTIYNLLAHFKIHTNIEMQRYKKIIAKILAEIVGYHYKCRVCRTQFDGIKDLRTHLLKHNCNQPFKCEVGNHTVNKLRG